MATDVAARGLHIPAVTHVFNYDPPDVIVKTMFTVSVVPVALAPATFHQPASEEYALNLPAIESYIGHRDSGQQIQSGSAQNDLPGLRFLTRARPGTVRAAALALRVIVVVQVKQLCHTINHQ